MDKYCRLCLKEDGTNRFFTFSHKLTDDLSVLESYSLLTSINLEDQQDRDNSKICKDCWFKLYSFHEFRDLALINNNFITGLKSQGINVPGDPLIEETDIPVELLPDIKLEVFDLPVIKEEEPSYKIEKPVAVSTKSSIRKSNRVLEKPEIIKKSSSPIECEEIGCNKVYSNKDSLTKHKKQAHPKQNVTMSKEDKKRAYNAARSIIEKNARKMAQNIICVICGEHFKPQSMKRHIKTVHDKNKQFVCDHCGKAFVDRYTLRNHILRHTNHRPYKCDLCEKSYFSTERLRLHKHLTHSNIKKVITEPIPCTYPNCNYIGKTKLLLTHHIRRIHLKIQKYVCECGRGFADMSQFREHRATHSDARNFECEVCKKRFKTGVSLTIHRKNHKAPKYPCEICGKPFHCPSTRNVHVMAVHEGLRSFACNLCDKNYAANKYLLDHIKEIHFKAKISCELCQTKLARVVNYRMHVKAKHKDIGDEKMAALLKRMKTIKADYENLEFYYAE